MLQVLVGKLGRLALNMSDCPRETDGSFHGGRCVFDISIRGVCTGLQSGDREKQHPNTFRVHPLQAGVRRLTAVPLQW